MRDNTSKLKDITGERFGRLVVVERVENDSNGQAMWLCQCDCGSEPKVIRGSQYSPDNCRWADNKTQQNNRTTNHYITINNNTKTLREWCDEYKISYVLVRDRINKLGWNPIVALTTQQRGVK